MKPSELKAAILAADPDNHFFDRGAMRFFGDSMANYGVRSVTVGGVEAWELYRRRPVRHGLQGSHYFAKASARPLWCAP